MIFTNWVLFDVPHNCFFIYSLYALVSNEGTIKSTHKIKLKYIFRTKMLKPGFILCAIGCISMCSAVLPNQLNKGG